MKKSIVTTTALIILSVIFFISCKNTSNNIDINSNVDMSERLISVEEVLTTERLAEIISPAVVGISSTTASGESVGSGVCVGKGGHIITNAHVVVNPYTLKLYLFNGDVVNAEQIFRDESLDISILKCEKDLPYLALGNLDQVEVGEDVLAVGTPISLLLKHSFTKGIVSALNRTLRVSGEDGDYYMQNLIQHDASLNPGNSGGPLINSKGEVIGINTLKISSTEGIGFAIPSLSFKSLLENYISDESYKTPYIGFFGYDAEIANYYQYTNEKEGVFVVDVSNNSPIKQVGVESGDVVFKIDDVKVSNILELRNELFKHKIGDKIELHYKKNGMVYVGELILQEHPVNNISNNIELINEVN